MEQQPETLDPRPLVLKRFAWDVFPHDFEVVREVQVALGLVPDGDSGMEVEHAKSDTRVNRAAPMKSALRALSGYAAEVVGQYMLACLTDPDSEVPERFIEGFARQNSVIIYESTFAILCHLLDTGVLEYGEKVRDAKAG